MHCFGYLGINRQSSEAGLCIKKASLVHCDNRHYETRARPKLLSYLFLALVGPFVS